MLNTRLQAYIHTFPKLKVLVMGEVMLDGDLKGSSEYMCREAPAAVVSVETREYMPDGAGNTAVNCFTLGAQVSLLSIIGTDVESEQLFQALEARGGSTVSIIRRPGRQTLAKQRVIATSQVLLCLGQGSGDIIHPEVEDILIRHLEHLFPQVDAVNVCDYGVLTPRIVETLTELRRREPRLMAIDSKNLLHDRSVPATAIKPNYEEAILMLGLYKPRKKTARIHEMEAQGLRLLELSKTQIAAITLDRGGALIFERGVETPYRSYIRAVPNTQAAGAGDIFLSAFTLSLAARAPTEKAAEIASAASSTVVERDGASACRLDELRRYFSSDETIVTDIWLSRRQSRG